MLYQTFFTVLMFTILVLFVVKFKYLFESIYLIYKGRFFLEKLPSSFGREFFFGHARKSVCLSPDKLFFLIRNILRKSQDVSVAYSPIVCFVAIKGPEEVESVIGKSKNLDKSRSYGFLKNWLGGGLLTCTGDKWPAKRKTLTPAFHYSNLMKFLTIFNKHTKYFLEKVEECYLNKSVNVVPLVSDFTLATIGETSMGLAINFDSEEGMEYKAAIHQMGSVVYKRAFQPWLWADFLFNWSRYRKNEMAALKVLKTFSSKIIKKRSQGFTTFDEKFDNIDTLRKCPLIDILLNGKFKHGNIGDTEIQDDVETFTFAGHDTSAMCINYTMMLLACNKATQEEVFQEIVNQVGLDLSNEPSYADLQEMNLLERCIKESLRLYPPVPIIGRKTDTDIDTKYGIIPKNADIFIPIYDIHRDSRFWPNPERFDPSRHLPENSQTRPAYAYMPFSVGPRNCIGQRFAMIEIKAFFCGVLRKFILEPIDTPNTLILTQEIVLRPINGIHLKFKPR